MPPCPCMHAGPEEGGSGPDIFVLHMDLHDLRPGGACEGPTASAGSVSEPLGSEEGVWDASMDALAWLDELVKQLMSHTGACRFHARMRGTDVANMLLAWRCWQRAPCKRWCRRMPRHAAQHREGMWGAVGMMAAHPSTFNLWL